MLVDRGFAFSQAAGNDHLVTDSFTDKMALGLMRKIEKLTSLSFNPVTAADLRDENQSVDSDAHRI